MNEEEKTLLGLMTFAYHNFHMIRDLTDHVLENPDSPVTNYYQEWCKAVGLETLWFRLNPGSLWMLLTTIFVSAKQQWFDIFPSTPISKIENK